MTTKIKVYQVDAFTNNLFSGNPAAVCLLDNWLPDKVMQSIALENNLSETAFLVQKKDKFFLRWFTPKVEIDLCGHATLASAHIIYSEMNYKTDYIEFNIKSGDVLTVNRNDNLLTMNFPAYEPKVVGHSLEELYNAFGVRPKSFLFCKYGLAVFNNEEEIIKIVPNFNVIEKLHYEGIIVTASAENVDFVSRFFAPKLGIPEDPVTGVAHCELIPYWSKRLYKQNMIAKQLSKRGGVIHCSYLGSRVTIGGEAITYMHGELLMGK